MSRRLYLGSKDVPFFNTFSFLIEWSSGLPTDARSEDVSKFFDGYGRIIDCRVMTGSWTNVCKLFYVNHLWIGFGFVEFENAKVRVACLPVLFLFFFLRQDAEDAVHNFNGKPFMGVKYVLNWLYLHFTKLAL